MNKTNEVAVLCATLRDMGFKTFGDIIDESYDEIEAPIERHAAALDQLKW